MTVKTPEDLARRTARAVAAATAAARELGVVAHEPKVLHDVFSVVVHLAPSPVVVRVPAVTPPGLDAVMQAERQARELDAVAWLADRGVPVRPSALVPRTPVQRDGFSMTFWEFVEVDAGVPPDYSAGAALVPELHRALRAYPAELPFLAGLKVTVEPCLAVLEQRPELLAPADYERARGEWHALERILSSREQFLTIFPNARMQALHGDAPSYNLIRTTSGVRYADFEDVTLGPIEWDLALLGPDAVDSYNTAAARIGSPAVDPAVLRVMDAARMLQIVACLALVPELPMLATGLAPSLDQWRTMPFAGGVT